MNEERKKFFWSILVSISFVTILWIVKLLEIILGESFYNLGILPKTFVGLRGILFTPLLHSDFSHLAGNSFPLIILIPIMLTTYSRVAVKVFVIVWLMGGLAVWLLSFNIVYHIGASGVVYGLAAFLLGSAFFQKKTRSAVIVLAIIILHSGILEGFFNMSEGISWEAHIYSAAVGIVCSFIFRKVDLPEEKKWEDEEEEDRHFFDTNPGGDISQNTAAPPLHIKYILKPGKKDKPNE